MGDEIIPARNRDAELIMELVSNVGGDRAAILRKYGLTTKDLAAKMRNPLFQSAFHEAEALWKSDLNLRQRVQMKAGYAIEDLLEEMVVVVRSRETAAPARVAAFSELMKAAGLQPKKEPEAESNERVRITINVGGGSPPVILDAERVLEHTSE